MATENHIRNPLEWGAGNAVEKARRIGQAFQRLRLPAETAHVPEIRTIGLSDIRGALADGLEDLSALRTDALSIVIIYPLMGIVIAVTAATYNLLPLVFPLASGFALIGPIAGIGLYLLSQKRELEASGEAIPRPAYGSIAVVGGLLFAIFVAWLLVAHWIFQLTLGPDAASSIGVFAREIFTTPAGMTMIVAGVGAGFLFAVAALAIGIVSLPLLLERQVGPVTAVRTSVRAVTRNPGVMAAWGAIVAASLVIGSAPALVGLVIVFPLLGHSTWHLYRRLIPRQSISQSREGPKS